MSLLSGTRLGPYEIVSLIGSGGMGEVYRARDARLGRDVAIKVLPPEFAADPDPSAGSGSSRARSRDDRLRRFEQEARAASALNHPNILAVHDVGSAPLPLQAGGEQARGPGEVVHYLVTELLEGESLRERLRSGGLPARKAVELAVQVASGLAAAHEKGIVHRDLKPENLFITADGHVKILDFGLAKLRPTPQEAGAAPTVVDTTQPGMVLGTVAYMSPEQVRGQTVDHRSDIFSFGAVLYEMVTGKPAFARGTPADTMSAILKEEPAEPASIEPATPLPLARAILHCLEKRPEERFQSARDLGFALESLSGSGASTDRAGSVQPSRTRRLAVGFVTGSMLGAVLVLVAGALAWWQHWPPFRVPAQPSYERITFRQGSVMAARFAPDGHEVLYSAAWEAEPLQTYAVSLQELEERPVGPSGADLLNLTARGDALLLLGARQRPDVPATPTYASGYTGTLAVAPWVGQLVPRERLEGVLAGDIASDGTLAVVREAGGRCRLECPPGTVRTETAGTFGPVRFSAKGDLLAFIEHPIEEDSTSQVGLVDVRTGSSRIVFGPSDWVEGLAWKDGEVWSSARDRIVAVRPDGGTREVLRLPGYVVLEDISPDGRVLLSRHDWRFGLIAFGEEGSSPQIISRGAWPWLEDVAPDGRILFAEQENPRTGGLYLASGDGRPAVKVGSEGTSIAALAPDRPSLAVWPWQARHILLLPTGAGEPRKLPVPSLEACLGLCWTRDGRLLISGFEAGHGKRIYVLDTERGTLTPLTEEGIYFDPFMPPKLSPDGTRFLARSREGMVVVPLQERGGEPRLVKGVETGEKVVGWCADSKSLYVLRWGPFPIQVWTLDPDTGRREKARTIDPKGYRGPSAENIYLTPDGKRGAMLTRLWHSELFVVTGLR